MRGDYNLKFDKCVNSESVIALPSDSGIYIFYEATNVAAGKWTINELVYIGKSNDFHDRFQDHETLDLARKEARKRGRTILIAYARPHYAEPILERIEACLIFSICPKYNTSATESFNYDETEVRIEGDCAKKLQPSYALSGHQKR